MQKRKTYNRKQRRDREQEVVDKIVAALESGVAPWVKPWAGKGRSGVPVKALSNEPYAGVNVLLLLIEQFTAGFGSNRWITYDQVEQISQKLIAKDLGKEVMSQAPVVEAKNAVPYTVWSKQRKEFKFWLRERAKGVGLELDDYPHVIAKSTSTSVCFYKSAQKDRKDSDGNLVRDESGQVVKDSFPIRKWFNVFNVEQVENLPSRYRFGETISDTSGFELDQRLDDRLRSAFPEMTYAVGGDGAFYRPSTDHLQMPDIERFSDKGNWYATSLHEHVHATGHASRLNRHGITKRGITFGDADYCREELVAELGSAFLCANLGIEGFLQHPEYIQMYVSRLKESKAEIFRAAAQAQKASDFMLKSMGLLDQDDQSDDLAEAS